MPPELEKPTMVSLLLIPDDIGGNDQGCRFFGYMQAPTALAALGYLLFSLILH